MTAESVRRLVDEAKPWTPPRADAESAGDLRALEFDFADELPDDDATDDLVEGLLSIGAMSVWYGDSNTGKTFAIIDLTACIARDQKWMGRHVEPGLVVYLAAESPRSVRTRLRAYQKHFGVTVPHFAIVSSPIDLFDGAADTDAVIQLVRDLEARTGRKCMLVVGDTLARLSAGANENSGEDMGAVVRHADRIRAETGAHFAFVHHCGKDVAKGARGWSGLRAATDTEVEITCDDATGLRCLEFTKQRDLASKGERIGFRLEPVHMGAGKWGAPRTSCIVVPGDAPVKAQAKRTSEIAGAIAEFLTARRSGIKKSELVAYFDGRYTRSAIYREMKRMHEAGTLLDAVGVVALAGERS